MANDKNKASLTLEQQFELNKYTREVDKASPEKLKEMIIELIRQSMVKDNLFKEMLKQKI